MMMMMMMMMNTGDDTQPSLLHPMASSHLVSSSSFLLLLLLLLLLLFTVALAGAYLDKTFHHHLIITGGATIHGHVDMVSKIKEKSMAGLKAFPNETMNMIIPLANTVGDSICNDYESIYRDQQGGRSRIHREWFTMDKGRAEASQCVCCCQSV